MAGREKKPRPALFYMSQYIIIAIVVGIALIIAARWIYTEISESCHGNIGCAGCPLAENCKKNKADGKAINKKTSKKQ